MEQEELLTLEDQAWTDLVHTVSSIPADRREVEGVVPGWSTHDLVWHTAYWAGQAAEGVERIRWGHPDPDDAGDEGSSDAETAAVVDAGRAMTWDEAMRHLELNRARAREALEAFDRVVPPGAIELFSTETTEHYRDHATQMRSFRDAES